jgi:hypothetical protein
LRLETDADGCPIPLAIDASRSLAGWLTGSWAGVTPRRSLTIPQPCAEGCEVIGMSVNSVQPAEYRP